MMRRVPGELWPTLAAYAAVLTVAAYAGALPLALAIMGGQAALAAGIIGLAVIVGRVAGT